MTLNPTPEQIRLMMVKHGVPLHLYAGWDTRGRPWAGPDGSFGLMGVVLHHTGTASATGSTGAPSLKYIATKYTLPMANWCIGRDGASWLLSAGSCWHSGLGGPWPAIGVKTAGNVGHFRLVGIEIDDPGTGQTITTAQIKAVGKILAAYKELGGWGYERIVTHGDWTDAGAYLKWPNGTASPVGPYVGRKNDTLRRYYAGTFWRAQAAANYSTVPPLYPGSPIGWGSTEKIALFAIQRCLQRAGYTSVLSTGTYVSPKDSAMRAAIGDANSGYAHGHMAAYLADGSKPGVVGKAMYASLMTYYNK